MTSLSNSSRLIVSLVVRYGIVYQSYDYTRLLPVGRLSVVLDRLGQYQVDECIIKLLNDDEASLIELQNASVNYPIGLVMTPLSNDRIKSYLDVGIDRLGFETDWLQPQMREKTQYWSEMIGIQSCFLHLPYGAKKRCKKFSARKWSIKDACDLVNKTKPPVGEISLWNISREHDYLPIGALPLEIIIDDQYNVCLGGGLPVWNDSFDGRINGILVGNIIHRKEIAYQKIKTSISKFNRKAYYKKDR